MKRNEFIDNVMTMFDLALLYGTSFKQVRKEAIEFGISVGYSRSRSIRLSTFAEKHWTNLMTFAFS